MWWPILTRTSRSVDVKSFRLMPFVYFYNSYLLWIPHKMIVLIKLNIMKRESWGTVKPFSAVSLCKRLSLILQENSVITFPWILFKAWSVLTPCLDPSGFYVCISAQTVGSLEALAAFWGGATPPLATSAHGVFL